MSAALEAAAVSVRLRRLWLDTVVGSAELRDSDLADAGLDVVLRRVGDRLEVQTPYDFGSGDPFDGPLGTFLRERVATVSKGAVREVSWRYAARRTAPRRVASDDLDVWWPDDPLPADYPGILTDLRAAIPAATPEPARAAVGALRLVAASRHRLWFAVPSAAARDALGSVAGARAALVTAIRVVQKADPPLYRVVVDASHRGKRSLLQP